MLGYYLMLLSVGSALGGVSIRMPYLNPAGVTYSSLEAAVPSPLLASPIGVRGFAYGSSYGIQTAAVAHAPLAVAHAPVAVAHAAVVSAVQHVPAVAHVPVTKYEAQPAVIQNVVDVHKPTVATRKFEIRRPAIEKQFYDIEERIVVRPAGKALVELDQPVSKNQRGPTVVSPAIHAQPIAAVRTLPVAHAISHEIHAPVIAATPQPIHVPAFSHPVHIGGPIISSTPAPSFDIQELPQQGFPQPPQQGFPQPPQQGFPQEPQQDFPQGPQQDFPQGPQQGFPQGPQQDFPQGPQPGFPQPPQSDDSDSVSIDNPEIARARIQQLQQPGRQDLFRSQQIQQLQQPGRQDLFRSQQIQQLQQPGRQDLFRSQQIQQLQQPGRQDLFRSQQIPQLPQPGRPDLFRSQQIQPDIFGQRIQQSEQISRQQLIERQQFDAQQQQAREQFERQQQSQERRFEIEQIERLFQQPRQFDRRIQPSGLERQMQADLQSRLLQQQPQRFDQGPPPQVPQELFRSQPRLEQGPQRQQELFRSQPTPRPEGPSVIPSFRVSPEQSLSNQERLIDLLTARGGVTEVRGAGERTLGGSQVRTRVLSVTPAPFNADAQDEKVNTRRIVVNRPITTVEEVDVVEPFTKVERVAVNQPAFIKTARVGVASVPTSVPVQTYAHAIHI